MKYKIKATDKVMPGKKSWSLQFPGYRRGFNRDTGALECEVEINEVTARQLTRDGYDVEPAGKLPDLKPLPDREAESWTDEAEKKPPAKKKTRKQSDREEID